MDDLEQRLQELFHYLTTTARTPEGIDLDRYTGWVLAVREAELCVRAGGSKMNLDRLRDLAEEAKPGPWAVEEVGVDELFVVQPDGDGGSWSIAEMSNDNDYANANFIAACDPQTILRLLDTIDALRERN